MSGEAKRAGLAFGVPDSLPSWGRWVVGPATCRSSSKPARVYFETQTNRHMKAAAPAAIAIQACVTIVPLVRAATSGSIGCLAFYFQVRRINKARAEAVFLPGVGTSMTERLLTTRQVAEFLSLSPEIVLRRTCCETASREIRCAARACKCETFERSVFSPIPYVLRHTFASNALAAGVGTFELARVMGTSLEMIERTYGHLVRGADDAFRSRLDAFAASRSERKELAQ